MVMDTNLLLVGLVIVALIAVAAWMHLRREKSKTLEKHFGPEYGRAVDELGSRDKAEAELQARRKRVEQLHIAPLAPAEAQHFSDAWRALQARFVDNPQGVLVEADQLVRELMQKRGYPMGDFERRAADISVDHPAVVDHYRRAHEIAQRDRRGEADTEALRQAVVHYRALFAELLEVQQTPPQQAPQQPPQQSSRPFARHVPPPAASAQQPAPAAVPPSAAQAGQQPTTQPDPHPSHVETH